MRLSDALKAKRADALDRLEKLAKLAAEGEGRLFTAEEQAEWERLQRDVNDLDKQLATQVAAEDLLRGGPAQRVAIDDQGGRHLILRSTDKLADRHPARGSQPLNIAKALKGLVT